MRIQRALAACVSVLAATWMVQCGGSTTGGPQSTPGSAGAATGPNEPGDCVAPDAGARFGYHSPDQDDIWLPDCDNLLRREYWRVFQKADGTAYTMPRPDGWEGWPDACERDLHPLSALGHRYGLCDGALDAAGVEQVNALAPADALAMTHHFHSELVFVADGQALNPFAIPSDILDICLDDDTLREGILKERCEFEIAAQRSGTRTDEAHSFTTEQALALARALNDLYGIEGPELCRRLQGAAGRTIERALDSLDKSCSLDEDCTEFSDSTACSAGCGTIGAISAAPTVTTAREQIERSICQAFETAACEPVMPLPCIGGDGLACVDGACRVRAPDEDPSRACNIFGESTCLDNPDACSAFFAWRFDEPTGTCTSRDFIQCLPLNNACNGAAGFYRNAQGQCFWSEVSACDSLTRVQPDASCGDGDPSMSGCGIH